jgi:hypothetical protein
MVGLPTVDVGGGNENEKEDEGAGKAFEVPRDE